MDDDAYCLFVTFACILTLAMPASAEAVFAAFAFALAVTARVTPGGHNRSAPAERDQHDVAG
jgi:hypothetical protein